MAEKIGPYEVTELLAAGGMAEIFVGRKTGPGGFEKPLVVKRIHKKLLGDREIEAMFVDEARVQALLDHPHIVQIYDFGEDRGSYFIAMEYIAGATLRWVIDNANAVRRPVPIQHALRIAGDVLCGLHYAHERIDDDGQPLKLIHRDISPVNVLVARSGQAKLCDFGVAKSEIQRVMTRAGIVKGKFRYMSPEQINAEPLDRRADVFAVGCVLWELLVGRRLFDHANEDDVVSAIRGGNYPDASDHRPGLPKAIDKILRRALHPNRDKRYRNAREFHLTLEEALRLLPAASNSVLVGEYVSAELDGTVAEYSSRTQKRPAPEHDFLASGFEMLDPPVPSAPTMISLPPQSAVEEADSEPHNRPPPTTIGRLIGASLMAPAALFSGLGVGVEKLVGLVSGKRRQPAVRVTRTRQ
ncbi:MAG: serine/threonine-protein kinase [Deltaproteobacteria bacterium]|nr:serine/threonine-protein kinase [Deltaproteobacteria bacterium]